MANQMIALQARNPQLPDPARATAQYANMMNMASQQRASQLQSERIRQEMEFAKAEEARAEKTQTATMREKDVDFQLKDMKRLRNIGVAVLESGNEEAYQSLLGMIEQSDPQFGATIRQVAPTFNAKVLETVLMEADKYIDKTMPNAEARLEFVGKDAVDEQGVPIPEGTGVQVTTGRNPSTKVIRNAPAAGAAAATPTAAAPAGSARTGRFGEALVVPDSARPLTADQQDHIRRMQEDLGMSNTPASFSPGASAGQMTPQRAQQIVDAAVNTRVMAQEDFDQMLAMTPEQNKQPFMEMIRANNIKLQPGGMGQQPQFADLRGQRGQSQTAGLGGDMSMMRNTEAQYIPLQRRDPNVSPTPGVYNVPTQDVAAKARAERETPGEVYAKEKARAKAQREAALEAGPKPLTVPQEAKLRDNITKDYKSARSTIDMMLNPVAGVVAAVNNVRKLSPTQKEAITGYSGYLPTIYAGTKSADTAVKNLKGKVTEMGKSVAALTGAIGQMAVQEWRIVSDMIASLDLEGMGAADLDTQLDIIEAQARRAAAVTRDAYENQYVEEFARYPGRFRLPDASAVAAPAAKRKTPTKGAVDRNNPLLRN
jgi:hypothetical protein